MHGPVRLHALVDFQAMLAGNQGCRLAGEHVVEMGPLLAGDLKQVAKAPGGDQTRRSTLAFEQGIRGHGGAEADEPDRVR